MKSAEEAATVPAPLRTGLPPRLVERARGSTIGHIPLAIADLEQAVAVREQDPGDAPALAESRFALALALAADAHARTDRTRSLATLARDGYRGAGPNFEAEAVKIDTWLAAK